ncbi:phage tail protein [Photobacterium halotolerans]|uniref:Phage tail protein n=1 Tax=Photobacterium halotolerans TaxID=265726 RepID=A0A7X4WB45_9GAMM|nr:tail fiber protein [Photobacterium halotolerans]NAW64120.1 phage tail protein [Photobacterium halotolerans]NAW85312.1 phage tail protein [Photobacterium halotolerans]NAX48776.1 phage tail protein [Photobacterium halotolerans]
MEPYIGNIQMFGASFAPKDYAFCNGQTILIHQNQALYALLGNTFGGTVNTNFKLPDLQGRMPVAPGVFQDSGRQVDQGQSGGMEAVALSVAQMPAHIHEVYASTEPGNSPRPNNKAASQASVLSSSAFNTPVYSQPNQLVAMNEKAISSTGAGQSHNNMQPSTVINFCIALTGLFPARD